MKFIPVVIAIGCPFTSMAFADTILPAETATIDPSPLMLLLGFGLLGLAGVARWLKKQSRPRDRSVAENPKFSQV